MIFWQILLGIGIIYIFIKSIVDVINHQRLISWNVQQMAKQKKDKEYIFVEEKESKMKCQYCGREISEEEYESERQGFCDECSDDLATEEETEDVWGI